MVELPPSVTVAPSGDSESGSDVEIGFGVETFSTLHLKEHDCSMPPRRRKGKGGTGPRKTTQEQADPPIGNFIEIMTEDKVCIRCRHGGYTEFTSP